MDEPKLPMNTNAEEFGDHHFLSKAALYSLILDFFPTPLVTILGQIIHKIADNANS